MIFGVILPHPGILRKFAREGAAASCQYSPRIRSPLGGTPERGGHGAGGLRRSQAGGGALAAVCLGERGSAGRARGRAARRGRFAGLSGADAGKARRAAGAGRQGRGGSPLPGRGGRRRGQNGCTQRGLCRVSGHLCDRGSGRAKKPVFAL